MRTLAAFVCLLGSAFAGEPAYRLEPGTELAFQGRAGATGTVVSTATVWVVRRNPDGTCRIVYRLTAAVPGGPESAQWSWCDMAPDGSYRANPSTLKGAPFRDVLPLLPQADAAPRSQGGETYTYRREGPGVFVFATESIENTVYGVAREAKVTLAGGLPKSIEVKQTRHGRTMAGTMELTGKTRRDPAWMEGFAAETELFFAAARRYDEEVDKQVLEAALAKAKREPVRAALERLLGEHEERAAYEAERRSAEAEIVGKPSAPWETTDFEGRKHSVAGHRGEVMILDFWFRRCGWCVRAMPQIKEIAEHFEGKPVAVLGMNVDRQEEDARFVIETLALNYPNLKARGIPEKYKVCGYPTLVVLDRKGVVRELHFGYSADLREKVVATVEQLLAEPD